MNTVIIKGRVQVSTIVVLYPSYFGYVFIVKFDHEIPQYFVIFLQNLD